MHRRAFLSIAGTVLLAGCSELPSTSSPNSIGDTAEFGPLEVTATDAMAASSLTVSMANGRREIEAPSNGTLALFEIDVRNTDIKSQEGPGVSMSHYSNMVKEDNEFFGGDANDIRLYGSGEAGHLPSEVENAMYEYRQITVNGTPIETWPVDVTGGGPQIDADGSRSGWVFGLIGADETPELKIEFRGSSAMWSAEGESLDTPTPSTQLPM